MPLPPIDHIVYGPVRSRRLGRSLGINLLPARAKVCNMNCAYCQYGWTRGPLRYRGQATGWPSPAAVEGAALARLLRAAETNEIIDRITVAGHGEPTLHPDFEEITERLCGVRDRVAPSIPIAILSNSTTAAWDDVRNGLGRYDERYMKLDAGDPITFARINGRGASVSTVVESLKALVPCAIQSMFVTEPAREVDNSTEGAVAEWLRAIVEIQPTRVQVYTLDRPPAMSSLRPVARRRLREIAAQVEAAGIKASYRWAH
jgi:wyosine [tRNA(Phe)-imidazoG37] synthetase (radical SAM superfamily)